MREIKFRALYKDGTWRYGEYPHLAPEMSNTIYPLHTFWEISTLQLRRNTIGQYTGLKDRNGKEIFEGDALQSAGFAEMLTVFWKEDWAAWAVNSSEWPDETDFLRAFNLSKYEVIGNIHENPELLESVKP